MNHGLETVTRQHLFYNHYGYHILLKRTQMEQDHCLHLSQTNNLLAISECLLVLAEVF